MKQIDVKFQPENEKNAEQIFTPFGGAVLIDEVFRKLGISHSIDEHIGARPASAGVTYTDSSYVKSLVLMQILGGDTVDDLANIRNDAVLREVMGNTPGRTSFHNYFASFVDEAQERRRAQGKSTLLVPNKHLMGFDEVTRHLLSSIPAFREIKAVTIDQDATFIPTGVSGALWNYKQERSFQALGAYCPEYDMTIRSEFRDGNVTPGYRQLDHLRETLHLLPESVEKVRLRSDSAGYQAELLKYCASGENKRFGVIEFAISCHVSSELMKAVLATRETEWRRIHPDSDQECAVIPFAPNSLSGSKNGPEYRFIATREPMCDVSDTDAAQQLLFPEEDSCVSSLHPTALGGKVYKIFALVTNDIESSPEEIVRWHRGRCGKSEEIHRVLKSELAGGHVVTSALGANAAWWQITVLTANLLSLIRSFLPKSLRSSRPKKLRYALFSAVARISRHARKVCVVIFHSAAASVLRGALLRLAMLQVDLE